MSFSQIHHFELVEVAYNEELSNRIDEIKKLSSEVISLRSTIDELLLSNNKNRLGRQDSSLEFEALRNVNINNTKSEYPDKERETFQKDLMTEINHYEELLKEKEKEIFDIDKKLGERDIKIEKLQQILSFNNQFLLDIQAMNKMIEKKTKKGNAPSRDESLEIQTFKESLEPETLNEFSQVTSRTTIQIISLP